MQNIFIGIERHSTSESSEKFLVSNKNSVFYRIVNIPVLVESNFSSLGSNGILLEDFVIVTSFLFVNFQKCLLSAHSSKNPL